MSKLHASNSHFLPGKLLPRLSHTKREPWHGMACLSWVKQEEKPERGHARQSGLQAAEFSPDAPWGDTTLPSLPPHGLPGAHFSTEPDSLLQPAAPHDEPPPWEGEFDQRNHPPKENSQPPRSPQPPMPWGDASTDAFPPPTEVRAPWRPFAPPPPVFDPNGDLPNTEPPPPTPWRPQTPEDWRNLIPHALGDATRPFIENPVPLPPAPPSARENPPPLPQPQPSAPAPPQKSAVAGASSPASPPPVPSPSPELPTPWDSSPPPQSPPSSPPPHAVTAFQLPPVPQTQANPSPSLLAKDYLPHPPSEAARNQIRHAGGFIIPQGVTFNIPTTGEPRQAEARRQDALQNWQQTQSDLARQRSAAASKWNQQTLGLLLGDTHPSSGMLRDALQDYENGILSSQELDRLYAAAGSPVSGTEAFHQELEHRQRLQQAYDEGMKTALGEGGGKPDPRLARDHQRRENIARFTPPRLTLHLEDGSTRHLDFPPGATRKQMEGYAGYMTSRTFPSSPRAPQIHVTGTSIDHPDDRIKALEKEIAPQLREFEKQLDKKLDSLHLDDVERAQVEQRIRLDAASRLPRSAGEMLHDPDYLVGKTPFVGGFISGAAILNAASIAAKVQGGGDASPEELATLLETLREMQRPNTLGATLTDGTLTALSTGVEFAATDGAFTAAKAAALRAGESALKKLATREGTQLVERKLLGAMAHSTARAAQLPLARLGAMTREAIADQLVHNFNVRQDGEGRVVVQLNQEGSPHSIAQSLFHAYGTGLAGTLAGDAAGRYLKVSDALKAFSRETQQAMQQRAVISALSKANGNAPLEKVAHALAAIADQAPGQFVAARATEAGAAVINGERWVLPTGEQVLAEMAGSAVPAMGGHDHGHGEGHASAHGVAHAEVRASAGGGAHASGGGGQPSRFGHGDSATPSSPNGPHRGDSADANPPGSDGDHPIDFPQDSFSMSQNGGSGQPDNNNPDSQNVRRKQTVSKGEKGLGITSDRDGADPLATAASDARGSGEADAGERPISWTETAGQQRARLEKKVQDLGLPTDWAPPSDAKIEKGGSEHDVWYSKDGKRVYKLTKHGLTGAFPQIDPAHPEGWDLFSALPADYLDRLAIQNKLFKSRIKLEGIRVDADGFHLATSQPFIKAADPDHPHPSDEKGIASLMERKGFEKVASFAWYNRDLKLLIADAKPDNFIQTSKGPVPVDIVIRHVGDESNIDASMLRGVLEDKLSSDSKNQTPPDGNQERGLHAAPFLLRRSRLKGRAVLNHLPDHLPATPQGCQALLRQAVAVYQNLYPALWRRFRRGNTSGRSGLETQFRDASGRITPESVRNARISVQEDKLAADLRGLSPRQTVFHMEHALGEEVRHLASLYASLTLWEHSDQRVPLEPWLTTYFSQMWQHDFASPLRTAILHAYAGNYGDPSRGHKMTYLPQDWQLAFEGLRMLSQARAGTLPTEADQLWHWPQHDRYPLPMLIYFIQQAALSGKLSLRIEWMFYAIDRCMRAWHQPTSKQRSGPKTANRSNRSASGEIRFAA